MTIDYDPQLRLMLDERLSRVPVPPLRSASPRKSRARVWVTTGIIASFLLTIGVSFGFEINAVAESQGAGCADVLTKIQIWSESFRVNYEVGRSEAEIDGNQKALAEKALAKQGFGKDLRTSCGTWTPIPTTERGQEVPADKK